MTKRIFRSILSVVTAVLAVGLLLVAGCIYQYFCGVQEERLRGELELVAAATEQLGERYLHDLKEDYDRLTLLAADGTVLYDTQADAGTMGNHADREEVKEALATGFGSSSRYSTTLTEKTLYEAVKLADGSVLRISVSQITAFRLLYGLLQPILIVTAFAIVLSAVLAYHTAKRIADPLNNLDLEHPLENNTYEELAPLLRRIHTQHQQIDLQVRKLKRKTDEFVLITRNMKEGLTLLDGSGIILSMNPAACQLFGADASCAGRDFLTVDRRPDIHAAIEKAMADGHSEICAERGGREYQFDLSRIESDGRAAGTVILAFDVTEQADAERRRREFTANVSHELKTPLQSIIGSAELIESGLVKSADMSRFVGHIHKEASRLVTLVEDIIRLSQLDEGNEMSREDVSFLALTEESFASLRETADTRGISLSVTGDATVHGVHQLLGEIVGNLCDNAVKYNVNGGSVHAEITETDSEITFTVSDTGIGIPLEHQSRVFERFYRVDKSHSKQSGGTGLGLSIVKHAVQYHHGRVTLRSEPGKGTAVTVTFAKS